MIGTGTGERPEGRASDFDDARDAPEDGETGGPKSGGLEGDENVSFSCYIPCHNMSISGRRRPRAHLGGFRARPARAGPKGRASRAEGPDRQSDAVACDPSKGEGASSIRRCRRPGSRSFERRTRFVRIVQSAGETSPNEALHQRRWQERAV